MPKSYATLNQFKATGEFDIKGSLYDPTLLRLLENASEDIDHLCFRHFDCVEGVMYCDGAGRTLIPAEDILSLSKVELDPDGSQRWSILLSASDYFLYPLDSYNSYPKQYLKMSLNASAGGFASGIQSGVRLTGVFGHGDGQRAAPYDDSGDTVRSITILPLGGGSGQDLNDTVLDVTANGSIFSAGQTIRIGSEQEYITGYSANIANDVGTRVDRLTVNRAVNGTTLEQHVNGSAISIYRYPGPVVEAALLMAANWWKQRENPTVFKTGNSITGDYEISTEIEKILTKRLSHHIKRKLA